MAGRADGNVQGRTPQGLHVGACGIEVSVTDHRAAAHLQAGEQDAFGRTPLVSGDHMGKTGQFTDPLPEAKPRAGAGIRLIAAHDAGPLL